MTATIKTPQVASLLDALYADASTNDPLVHQAVRASGISRDNHLEFYTAVNKAYMPVNPGFGNLLYSLARTSRAKTVVEFGTSFGISTIFLASAVRDNGGGRVITTEFDAGKAAKARENLAAAGLEDLVEIRLGDALETLKPQAGVGHGYGSEIDMVLLDGAKGLYLDVLKLLESRLRSGAVIASDNTDHDGLQPFLDYLRAPANGYTSSAIGTDASQNGRGHEISTRN